MFVQLIESTAKFLVYESIRDESLGDLWESDHHLKELRVPKLLRLAKTFWSFLLIIKASAILLLEEEIIPLLKGKEDTSCEDSCDPTKLLNFSDFTDDDIIQVKHYCDNRYLYNPDFSKKLLALGSPTLRSYYWINKAERIIEKYQGRTRKDIDSEAIVNSFMLSSLVRKIESTPPQEMDIRAFSKLVKEINLTPDFIDRYVKFDPATYKRQLIFRTWSLAVYVISWMPGQESWAHHHGYALDAIKVIHGKMTHWHLKMGVQEGDIPFECFGRKRYEGPSEVLTDGDVVLVDRCCGHQVGNLSTDNLVTLHFRFGHPPEDDYWRTTDDTEMFVWNQTEGCFDLIQPDPGRYSSILT